MMYRWRYTVLRAARLWVSCFGTEQVSRYWCETVPLSVAVWTDYLLVVATDVNQSRLMTNRGFHGRASGSIVALLCILQDASITSLQLGREKRKKTRPPAI